MTEKIVLNKKMKESVKNASRLIYVPMYTIFIYLPFSALYLAVFGNAAQYGDLYAHPVYKLMLKSQIFSVSFMEFYDGIGLYMAVAFQKIC